MMHLASRESQPAIRPLTLGPERLENNLLLAPMAGVTNLPFRLIARQAGAALVFTETVSATGLVRGGAKTWRLLESAPAEEPLAYQLFGNDADTLAEATRVLVGRGARFVDLNLGCPVKKFIKRGAGSALLRTPSAVAPLVAAMRGAIPDGVLSVKMRLGWSVDWITAPEVARVAESAGADFLSVHGRTRGQLYRGRVDLGRIAETVAAVAIPVFANGDILSAHDALRTLAATGAAGVMIGRGAMSNPWIFSQTLELARGEPPRRPSAELRIRTIEQHLRLMLQYFGEPEHAVHMLKKYLCAYSSGLSGSSAFRERVHRAQQLDRLVEDARVFFASAR